MDYNKIIEDNTGLIISVINLFNIKNREDREDLLQYGRIGLWKSLKRYNPSQSKISTFCRRSIFWQISTAIRQMNKNNRLSINKVSYENIDTAEETAGVLSEYIPFSLNEIEKKILDYKIQNHSFREIGYELNLSTEQVKRRFYKILKCIKENNE